MRWENLSVAAALVGGAISVPLSNSTNTTAPCGLITQGAINQFSNPSNPSLYYFDPSLANACLQSSAIDNELAASFVTEYKKYVEFQTTLSYLKAPPSGYPYAPVDILGGLDSIASKAAAGGFSSQYAFDQALAQLLTSAHEGHLFTSLCTAQAIFYSRTVEFISLSVDGVQLPLIYTLDDARQAANNITVSNVVAINGQNATAFIQNEALFQASDPDSSYNSMFWNLGQEPTFGFANGSLNQPSLNFYPGPSTNLTFANGTYKSFPNRAAVSENTWSADIIDGETFTDILCIAPAQSNEGSAATSAAATSSATGVPTPTSATPSTTSSSVPNPPTMLGHPEIPIVKDPNNAVAGYFLNGSQYSDTAVLYVASFDNENFNNPLTAGVTFQNTTAVFFEKVKAANKTKLIIDLSGNGGGNTLLPNDLFQRLFPQIVPYGAGRYKIPTAGNIYGESLDALTQADVTPLPTDNDTVAQIKIAIEAAPWNYRSSLDTNLQNLTSWAEFFPPNVQNGDNFTINVRAPTNNTYFDESTDSIIVYPVGQSVNPQPFPVQNIVIITDGICASACSIFTEFMTRQAGVKTIVVGGRPQHTPMQAIGGTKGSEAFNFQSFQQYSVEVLELGLVPDSLLDLANETLPGLVNLPLGDPANLKSYSLNMRDNIPVGDNGQIPLQFVFEPANCRIFYDFLTATQPHKLWEYAADIAWRGKQCAWGGINTNVTVTNIGGSSNSTNSTKPTGTPSPSPTVPVQVTKGGASGRNVVFSTMAAMVGFTVIMQMM